MRLRGRLASESTHGSEDLVKSAEVEKSERGEPLHVALACEVIAAIAAATVAASSGLEKASAARVLLVRAFAAVVPNSAAFRLRKSAARRPDFQPAVVLCVEVAMELIGCASAALASY